MQIISFNRLLAVVIAVTATCYSMAAFSKGANEGARVDLTGTLTILHIDHLDKRGEKNIYMIEDKLNKRSFKLKFEAEPPVHFTSGTTVRVKGRVHGEELVLEANGTGSIETLAAQSTIVSGSQRTLVMVADFKDVSVSCPINDIQNLIFTDPNDTSLDDFYQTNSLGQVSFSGDVTGPYPINYSSTGACDYTAWASAAEAKAKANGYDPSAYSRKVYVMPKNSCGAAGIGTVGGNPSRAWVFYCGHPSVYAHEIGHNLRFQHASSLTSEYGDNTDVMGLTNGYTHFNGPHKEQMGWLPDTQVRSANQDGIYDIAPLEEDPTQALAPQVLKISKPDTGEYYYLSYRRMMDDFSNLPLSSRDRLSVHRYKGDGSTSKTYLHGTFADGEIFSDTINGISVTQLSHTPSLTTVDIQFDTSCTASIPGVSITPANQIGSAGTTLNYTVSVSNTDGRNCSQSTFDLYPTVPSGWNTTITPNALALMPGDTGTSTLSVTSPANATEASYGFNVEALDAIDPAHTAEASGIYEVFSDTEAPTPPTLSASAKRKGINLSWSGATDNVGVVSYTVWRDQLPLTITIGNGYSDQNVSSGISYDYSVTAHDAAGLKSASSNSVSVTAGNRKGGGGGKGRKN